MCSTPLTRTSPIDAMVKGSAVSLTDSLHSREDVQYFMNCLSYFCLIMCHVRGTNNVHNWLSISSNNFT